MYQQLLSRAIGFAGAGPREDLLLGTHRGLDSSVRSGVVNIGFQIFGPLIVAFFAGLIFVGAMQVEFSQFSNWYIRIIFSISILFHLLLLFAYGGRMGFWGIALVLVSFAFTVLQILAALSLVQLVLGVELKDGSLLQQYRDLVLNAVTLFGMETRLDEQIGQVGKLAYKVSYDLLVQVGAGLVLAGISAIGAASRKG
ncbi:hypothetical protein [Hyphococcus sp. DH-69]|uniref:hypothetical protein n=1 Tax=Hyphococcus formosus TaxID=3143534 RepID=UPI00398B146C